MTQIPKKGCALITGAGGRLGQCLLAARAYDAKHGARLSHDFRFQSRGPTADIQWAPGQSLNKLPRCGTIIGLWGATSGNRDVLAENTRLVAHSAGLARQLGAARVVHISSAAVYGPGQMMDELHPTENCNIYGKSKLDMENAVALQRKADGLEHICLRLANVMGADSLAPALRGSGPVTLHDFSTKPTMHKGPVRSYITAAGLLSVFDALMGLAPETWPPVLNIACPTPFSLEDIARAAGKNVIWETAPAHATQEVTLDVSHQLALMPQLTFATTAGALIAELRRLESHA